MALLACMRPICKPARSSLSWTKRPATTLRRSRRRSIRSPPRRRPVVVAADGFGGGGGGRGGRGGGPQASPTLESVSNAMIAAAMAMQNADVTPTASQVDGVARARAQSVEVMRRWNALKGAGLTALNAKRKAAGLPVVSP